jgi:uncharacterized protein (DUF488 family)
LCRRLSSSFLNVNKHEISLYTVGHSSRTLSELMELLRDAGIVCLVDVRRYPRSTRHPQFDSVRLRKACEGESIFYHWVGEQLGGHRTQAPDSLHTVLPEGLRGYADYMQTEKFLKSVSQLIELATRGPTAILCAEKRPQDCHRSLISDYLRNSSVKVEHLIEIGVREIHVLNPHARLTDGRLRYDGLTQGALPFDG